MIRINFADVLHQTPRRRQQACGRGCSCKQHQCPRADGWIRPRHGANHARLEQPWCIGRPIQGCPAELVSSHKQKRHPSAIGSRYKAGCWGEVPARSRFRLARSGVRHVAPLSGRVESCSTRHAWVMRVRVACVCSANVGCWGGENTWVRLRARRTFGTVPRDTDNGVDPAWDRRGGQSVSRASWRRFAVVVREKVVVEP